MTNDQVQAAARVLRQWWSFNDRQQHTHSWHDRENFIEKELPKLIAASATSADPALDPATVERIAKHFDSESEQFQQAHDRARAEGRGSWSASDEHARHSRMTANRIRALASGETK